MREEMKEIIDYNGEGAWARDAILTRYASYCRELKSEGLDLTPKEHVEGSRKWFYPVMEKVIAGIERGDQACKRIGIEYIEEDEKFPFGKILKSNTARALRRAELSKAEIERIRKLVIHMLIEGNVPHEFKEYAKLLKKIGIGDSEDYLRMHVKRENPYVMKYFEYLMNA
jgi:hypothetical protein